MFNLVYVIAPIIIIFLIGIRRVRPNHKGLIERLGKPNRYANEGFHWIIPFIEKMQQVNIREQMIEVRVDVGSSSENTIIKANAKIFFKVDLLNNKPLKTIDISQNRYSMEELARSALQSCIRSNFKYAKSDSDIEFINTELIRILRQMLVDSNIKIISSKTSTIHLQ